MEYFNETIALPIIDDLVRSDGLHISELIARAGTALGVYPYDKYPHVHGKPFEMNDQMRLGLMFEETLKRHVIPMLNEKYRINLVPGEELHVDHNGLRIYFSPDLVDYEAGIVYDAKLTWRSSYKTTITHWPYMSQIKSYLYALGFVDGGFITCYLNGNYKPPTPVVELLRIRFDQSELDDNWNTLTRYIYPEDYK